jgi:hypothetical protein
VVEGRAVDGTRHTATATLDIDIRAGARIVDGDAQREIILVQADAARSQARAHADRGAMPAAAAILRQLAARIDAVDGFVRNDGSILAELREQLEDEAANYERKATDVERVHQRKAAMAFKSATPGYARAAHREAPIKAALVGISGPLAGNRFPVFTETLIGRSPSCAIPVASGALSRNHARIMFVTDHFVVQDLGSTNGTQVNGADIHSHRLAHGDVIKLGDAELRFELASFKKP